MRSTLQALFDPDQLRVDERVGASIGRHTEETGA